MNNNPNNSDWLNLHCIFRDSVFRNPTVMGEHPYISQSIREIIETIQINRFEMYRVIVKITI